ncbi:MAG: arginase family protein [Gemmatimonadales bacterium]|nr:arginase family protein [Gemmatimonadales bacterium]NIN49079.1 arginase family protein [Gemmatimonadales bacterium]NIP06543.1 arginase family protein [Gemmatimonadales bacterium]NIR00240.1 arginase family protein [Gemmatimonadales bacterium]NIS64573.1 arginase family protein [Gemmatimonadales bacterium]
MRVRLIQVPYDSGHRDARMGSGPGLLTRHGAERAISNLGHGVTAETVAAESAFTTEVGTALELNRGLAQRVRAAVDRGEFPLVLAGNCNSCLGTLAGLGGGKLGVVWFDAHGDFNTPETTVSGFFDGMALATATGRCWSALAATIPGFVAIPENHVVLVAARDFDAEEKRQLDQSAVALVAAEAVRTTGVEEALGGPLAMLRERVARVYLHIDLDVLDPSQARANQLAAPGGLTVEQVTHAVRLLQQQFEVAACAVTAYDPACDEDGRTLRAAMMVLEAVLSV